MHFLQNGLTLMLVMSYLLSIATDAHQGESQGNKNSY